MGEIKLMALLNFNKLNLLTAVIQIILENKKEESAGFERLL